MQEDAGSPSRGTSGEKIAPAASQIMATIGGAYIPPARLRAMQAHIKDKASEEYQRLSWEALKKSINGLINKANTSNIKNIIPELISENLIRGRGMFCRSMIKSQSAALPFTPVYTALILVLNTKFPQLGSLICTRLILQFRRAYRRNDKLACLASTKFLAHLVNFRVMHEIIALEILMVLLEKPTDDSVEVAVGMMKECGAFLSETQSRAVNAVFERFRTILHEGALDLRTQYMIEVLFQVRKDKFKDNPAVPEGLDLVDEEDIITHQLDLDDTDLDVQDSLNVFHVDPNFIENEEKYQQVRHEILGSSDEEDQEDEDGEEQSDDESDDGTPGGGSGNRSNEAVKRMEIQDQTDQDIITIRRVIYLTIMSSLSFEECVHKLMKLDIAPGQEHELCSMIIECCSQERTYMKFYGQTAERFAKLNRLWTDKFAEAFQTTYDAIHRYETNRLRNVSKLFAHMLATDALPWQVLACVRLTEDATTSSSRIFLKILFLEVNEQMGIVKLNGRLKDPFLRTAFDGLFPRDTPKNTRFAINYWTSIGLGAVTEELREWLKTAPKLLLAQQQQLQQQERSDSSSSSSSSSSDSDSDSDTSAKPRNGSRDRTLPQRQQIPVTATNTNQFVHPSRRALVPVDTNVDSNGKSRQRSRSPLDIRSRGRSSQDDKRRPISRSRSRSQTRIRARPPLSPLPRSSPPRSRTKMNDTTRSRPIVDEFGRTRTDHSNIEDKQSSRYRNESRDTSLSPPPPLPPSSAHNHRHQQRNRSHSNSRSPQRTRFRSRSPPRSRSRTRSTPRSRAQSLRRSRSRSPPRSQSRSLSPIRTRQGSLSPIRKRGRSRDYSPRRRRHSRSRSSSRSKSPRRHSEDRNYKRRR